MSGSTGLRADLKKRGVDVLKYVSPRKTVPGGSSGISAIKEKIVDFFTLPPFPAEINPVLFPQPAESFLFKAVEPQIKKATDAASSFARRAVIYILLAVVAAAVIFFFARGVGTRLANI